MIEKKKKYQLDNIEHIKKINKEYYQKNKEKFARNNKRYKNKNIENIKISNKNYRENNKTKVLLSNKTYRDSNKDKTKEYYQKIVKLKNRERYNVDPLYRLITNIRSLINYSFKSKNIIKNQRTLKIIGCSFEEFKSYIEVKFEYWMTWENSGSYTGNYNETWQLDHIVPISSAKTEDDIYKLNHYSNLRPLCSKKNLEKSNKII